MSEFYLEEDENLDDNEIIKKPFTKQRRGQELSTNRKKKTRRSRIIINDSNESNNDHKKEIYDPETKYKKSLNSALSFNEYINNSRKDVSKKFLKRKIKSAYEREPIEKNKGFYFNVSFMPTASMFTPVQLGGQIPQGSQQQGSRIPPQASNSNSIPKQDSKTNIGDMGNIKREADKIADVNTTNVNKNNIEHNKLSKINVSLSGRNVFNVNQSTNTNLIQQDNSTNSTMINSQLINNKLNNSETSTHDTKIKNIEDFNEIDNQNMKINRNFNTINQLHSNEIVKQPLQVPENLKSFPKEIVKAQILQYEGDNGNNNSTSNTKFAVSSQQNRQQNFRYIMELLHKDPEKLKKEIGINEFNNLINFVESRKRNLLKQKEAMQEKITKNVDNDNSMNNSSIVKNNIYSIPIESNTSKPKIVNNSHTLNLQTLQNISSNSVDNSENLQKQIFNKINNPYDGYIDNSLN